MHGRRRSTPLRDQRGFALPLALIVMTLLTALTLAFLGLGSTEPTISTNLKRGEQALAHAEAGIERAIWAMSNPTVDTAGANTQLGDLTAIPGAYSNGAGQLLFPLTATGQANPSGAYTVAIAGVNPTTLTAHGYVLRNGVALPAGPTLLNQADVAAHRVVVLQVDGGGINNRVGGPAAPGSGPGDVKLPGALTVAGSVEMSGNSMADGLDQAGGTPNNCGQKAGITIRDKTTLSDGTIVSNSISVGGSAQAVGAPGQQQLNSNAFAPFQFNDAQLAALKALAQQQGASHYIRPTSNAEFNLTLIDGLMFVDTVNGQALGTPPDPTKLASVKITGANNSGWLIVMGSVRIDGDVTYNGFVYAHNDLSYKGTGNGGIFGGVLSGNVVDSVATVVDTDQSGNSKIYYDCAKIASGGGTFTPAITDQLNRSVLTARKGTWREVSN
jgi:Tfp pilus assembly protein PilX